MRVVNFILLSVFFLSTPMATLAGNLDDPGAPTSSASAMYTLADIYNRLDTNTKATKRAGTFTEPSSAPGSTGYTLDEIYTKAIPTQASKTGQTTSYSTGDDGNLQKGIAWPNPRFNDNGDGTVTDNLTNLIWLKDANCFGTKNWTDALADANALNSGECGLSDSSAEGDWHLPNVKELQTLIDWQFDNPALSDDAGTGQWTGATGSSFTNVQSQEYWSSTTYANYTPNACFVNLGFGDTDDRPKTDGYYVWPVRSGQ